MGTQSGPGAAPGGIRTFVCARPDDESVSRLAAYLAELSRFKGYKWVEPENIHVTLLFIGEVSPSRAAAIDGALSRAGGSRPFAVRASGWGGFPDKEAPRAIWIGVREGARELASLAERVSRAASGAGAEFRPVTARRFRAHITLGRVRGEPRPLPEELADALTRAPALAWTCGEFTFMRSELTSSGPIYTPIASYAL